MKKIHSLSFSLPRGDQTADSTREEASCRKKRLDPSSETSGCLALGRRLHAGKNMPEKTQRLHAGKNMPEKTQRIP